MEPATKSKQQNFHLPLPPALYERLSEAASLRNQPATQVAREALGAWLALDRERRIHAAIAEYSSAVAGTSDDLDPALELAGIDSMVREIGEDYEAKMPRSHSPSMVIDQSRFDNEGQIESRSLASGDSGPSLRRALRFLYSTEGSLKLERKDLLAAEALVEPAEQIVMRFLYNKIAGQGRAKFGPDAVRTARQARYRCQRCDQADVETLDMDHVEGRTKKIFELLCGNCHRKKTRRGLAK